MKSSKKYFIASVDDNSIEDIKVIAQRLKDLGCKIDSILAFSGVISGSTDSNTSLKDLEIDGIKNVEPDRKIRQQ